MDNKLKNWADNFKPTPQEDVWNKIIVKKSRPEKSKLSYRPTIWVAAIAIIFVIILAIALNFLQIFRSQKTESKTDPKIELNK